PAPLLEGREMNPLSLVRAKFLSCAALAVCGALAFGLTVGAPSAEIAQAKKVNKYIGAQKCKNCHAAAESGNQFEALGKMKHAHAFAVLATEDAKKSAKDRGVTDPQKDDKTLGVQCETCHGPGELHMKARMAAAAAEGDEEELDSKDKGKKYVAVPKD